MALLESLDTTSVLATVLVLVAAYLYILNTCCRPVARKHPRGKKYKRVARVSRVHTLPYTNQKRLCGILLTTPF